MSESANENLGQPQTSTETTFTHALTEPMLQDLHSAMTKGIAAAGNPTDYFATGPHLGVRLTTNGWKLQRGNGDEGGFALTERQLHRRLKESPSVAACFEQILTKGLEYDSCSETEMVSVRDTYGSLEPPRPGQVPQVVTIDLDGPFPMRWDAVHWFDYADARPIARVRTDCCDRLDQPYWLERMPRDVTLWRTRRGRWVAEIHDRDRLGDFIDQSLPAWAEVMWDWAAHLIWCQPNAQLTEHAAECDLAMAAVAARGITVPSDEDESRIEAHGDVRYLASPELWEKVFTVQFLLTAALGADRERLWAQFGDLLTGWTGLTPPA